MKISTNVVPARYFALLVDYLESKGYNGADLLRAARIRSLDNSQATLTSDQMESLLSAAESMANRVDLGFELGRLIKISAHDILGYALISSPTLHETFRLVSRYYRLIFPLYVMRYQRHQMTAEILFQPVISLKKSAMRSMQETIAVSFHLQLEWLLQGHLPGYDIYMSIAEPPHIRRYRELAPARFHFGDSSLPGIRIVVDAALLDAPLPMADRHALALAEARCKTLMHNVTGRDGWSEWVRMMLRNAEDCWPSLDELARILNISSRTLDRYLAKDGNSFRELSKIIRHERACELLHDGKTSISQIAYRLGYSDATNFGRAFRHLSGVSPTNFLATNSITGAEIT